MHVGTREGPFTPGITTQGGGPHLVRIAWAAAFLAAGCDVAPEAGSATCAAPIIDGTPAPGEHAVVFIEAVVSGSPYVNCSGTVVAPRVVVTARHCVEDSEPTDWSVVVGPDDFEPMDRYRIAEIRISPLDDFAILILDADFAYGTKRWEFSPWPALEVGSTVTAVGYGMTDPDRPDWTSVKYSRDGEVTDFYARAIESVGTNSCYGDSGGALLFQDVLVGVIVRGDCESVTISTRVGDFADLVREALRDTGACVPTGFETCNGLDDDCWNGVDDGLWPACGCPGGLPSLPETCNGLDDDCDGTTDEDLPACACRDGAPSRTETCNAVDDDCNNAIDDLDACACRGGAPPQTETCNAVDDDCNGAIDEVCAGLGEPCADDDECATPLCADVGGERVCTASCTAGLTTCPAGGVCAGLGCAASLCRAAPAGSAPLGAPCTDNGDCAGGFCAAAPGAAPVCARPCVPDGLDCWADEICVRLAEGCGACVPATAAPGVRPGLGEPCGDSAPCAEGQCFTDGDRDACGDGCTWQYCVGVGCTERIPCPESTHCRSAMCVRGPLSEPGQPCAHADDCRSGDCREDAGGVPRCAEACGAGGACTPGFACADGRCWPTAARLGDGCAVAGDPCEDGECARVGEDVACVAPCDGVGDCPAGLACVATADRTRGSCVPYRLALPPVAEPQGAADGCGCRAAGSGAGFAGPWLAAAAVAALGRRRRATRSRPSHPKAAR